MQWVELGALLIPSRQRQKELLPLKADLKAEGKRKGRVELEVFFSFFTIMISLIGSTRQSFDSTGMPWLDYPISRPTLKVEMPAERADAVIFAGAFACQALIPMCVRMSS